MPLTELRELRFFRMKPWQAKLCGYDHAEPGPILVSRYKNPGEILGL